MNKEDILAQAQQQGKGKDVADLDAQRKGAYLAYFVGLFIIIIWDIVEGLRFHYINYGGNMALFAMAFTAFLVKFSLLRKKHEIIPMTIYGVCTIVFLVLWILQLTGVMPR